MNDVSVLDEAASLKLEAEFTFYSPFVACKILIKVRADTRDIILFNLGINIHIMYVLYITPYTEASITTNQTKGFVVCITLGSLLNCRSCDL